MNELSEEELAQFAAYWNNESNRDAHRLIMLDSIDRLLATAQSLRAALAERDELLGKAGEVLGMFSMVRFDDGEQLARIDLGDNRSVQFYGGHGFFGNEVFFIATARAASLASELKEKQP